MRVGFGDVGHTAFMAGSTVNAGGTGQVWVEEENADDNHGSNVMNVSNWSLLPEFGFRYVKWSHA
jgi:hypothetical protein